MGFGGGNFSQQDTTLLASMLGQQNQLNQTQSQYMAQVNNEDSAILSQFRSNVQQLEGATKPQQKKAVSLGLMDYIKTSPAGLQNQPANTGLMGLIG